MAIIPIRRKWKEGTYMRLVSPDRLRQYVTTMEDREAYFRRCNSIKAVEAAGDHASAAALKAYETSKISQAELARSVEVHRSFISQLVTGERRSCTPLIAQRIAERLGVPLNDLFQVVQPEAAKPRRQRTVSPEPVAA